MTTKTRVKLELLQTGVPGLDRVLGGGIPEYSFNLVAGGPGTGKTTLAQQIMFANATPERPALFFTVLGEPAIKLLRYQQQFDFFDVRRVGVDVFVHNLNTEVARGDLDKVLARIVAEVEEKRPGIVTVDSFRTVFSGMADVEGGGFHEFVQRLALMLTNREVTSFLIGEYREQEMRNPVFTVADGIVWLTQAEDRNSVVRKLQVVKQRGLAQMPGLHTMRVTSRGVEVFPRLIEPPPATRQARSERPRAAFGIPELDQMLGGGIPAGDAVVIAGPTGTGKTAFATRFVAEGAARGEAAVILVFEERPPEYMDRARTLGLDLGAMVEAGRAEVLYLRPLDLSVDETLHEIRCALERTGAKRLVIDSLSGFELALAPTFREDFRESLYRLVTAVTASGVTVLMTVETMASSGDLRLLPGQVSFLADDILMQRYVELDGELRTVLGIVKMRGSRHSRALREYEITGRGVTIGRHLRDYDGVLSGSPRVGARGRGRLQQGLTPRESEVLAAIVRVGSPTLDDLVGDLGFPPAEMKRAIDRLVALGFVAAERGARPRAWRAVVRGGEA
jgi:circadian clock protein KaiC